jgi:hypothetical protein
MNKGVSESNAHPDAILFFCNGAEDYLADGLLHGLKTLLGEQVVDFPRCDFLYEDCPPAIKQKVRGNGFTLYTGLLGNDNADRSRWNEKIRTRQYRLVVFSDIWNQWGLMVQSLPYLNPGNTAVLDTADSVQPYPYAGFWWRRPYYWLVPRAHTRFKYFKREWTPATIRHLYQLLIPEWLAGKLPPPRNYRRISFSIPPECIVTFPPAKDKTFATHVVDSEMLEFLEGTTSSYAFETQADYYADLQRSRYAITTKRAGWDCLRHYEIAANGCVPCFRALDCKPDTCAPHGLNETNCVTYNSPAELLTRLKNITEDEYRALQRGAIQWAWDNSTVERARQFLAECGWSLRVNAATARQSE